jgi:hypothetical protein
MFCNKCGSDNLEDAKFCRNCGETLEGMTEAAVKPIFKPLSESDTVPEPEAAPLQPSAASSMPLTAMPLPKKKSHKALFIILGSVLAVLVVLCAVGFLLRNQITKTVMPEQYLQMSIARTAAQSQKNSGALLDFSKFATGAVKHDFTVEMADEYSDYSLDGNYMYDAASEKALLNVSFETSGVSLDDNILYVSGDQIALSIPSQITDTDFLTIDPATFNKEWTDKGYDDLAEIPDLQELINTFFGKSEDGKAASVTDVNKDLLKYLTDEAKFSTGGTVTENIGGTDRKLDVMTYTISKSDANKSFQDFVSQIEDKMAKAAEMYASSSSHDVSGAFAELENLEIGSDIKITFYIDQDGYINRIELDDIEITSDEDSVDVGLVMDIWNKNGTTYTSAELSMDAGSESASIMFESESSFKDGVYAYNCKISSDEADTDLTVDLEWDTKDKKGENLSLVFEENSGDNTYEATLTGNLVTDKSKISLSDATLDFSTDSEQSAAIDFSYSLSKIDASEIKVDTSDSIPLLSYQAFKDYMDMVLSYSYDEDIVY